MYLWVMEKESRLTFIEDAGRIRYAKQTVLLVRCKCSCGNEVIVRKHKFLNKYTRSCGCINKEKGKLLNKTHGMTNTPEYRSWAAMITRCTNPNAPQFKNYGGRGIFVCEDWLNSFECFFNDMGLKPSKKHSIDRIDNNFGYNKANCKWSNAVEQCSNKTNNRKYLYKNETLTVTEISRRTGINRTTISNWANRSKYSKEKIERLINEK